MAAAAAAPISSVRMRRRRISFRIAAGFLARTLSPNFRYIMEKTDSTLLRLW